MPWDIDRMRPSQVASIMGLDRRDAVTAVPFDQQPAPKRKGKGKKRGKKKPVVREAVSRAP